MQTQPVMMQPSVGPAVVATQTAAGSQISIHTHRHDHQHPHTKLTTTKYYRLTVKMQRIILALSLVASAAVGVLAAELKIDVTTAVECERKTQKGDTIEVHYRGTLENGNKFDASAYQLAGHEARPT